MASYMYGGALILTWIILSTALIFQNKSILSQAPYPLTLTAGHVAFAWLASSLLKHFAPGLFYRGSVNKSQDYAQIPSSASADTQLQIPSVQTQSPREASSGDLDEQKAFDTATPSPLTSPSDPSQRPAWMRWLPAQVDSRVFWTRLVPAGALFAASLGLSNAVYLYLSVTTIQIIKSGSPIAVMTASFLFGLKSPSLSLICIILLISAGAGVASFGAADFNVVGVTLQVVAIGVEATRLTLTQTLLHGFGFGPLESINATSPICLVSLALLSIPFEGREGIQGVLHLGPITLVSNLSLSFALNVSSVFLIDLSSLVMSLSKVVKDIILILGGTLLLGEPISSLQALGYSIALVGLGLYKYYS